MSSEDNDGVKGSNTGLSGQAMGQTTQPVRVGGDARSMCALSMGLVHLHHLIMGFFSHFPFSCFLSRSQAPAVIPA
jgi:hypothetical protein